MKKAAGSFDPATLDMVSDRRRSDARETMGSQLR